MAKEIQKIEQAKGRPLLQWVGKHPLESVEYYPAQEKEVYGDLSAKDFNKLFWGDNLQVLSHLLKEYRGAVDLIYIDPPFDSKADYVRKVKLRNEPIEGQRQGLLEEKQYSDIWEKDEYLQFMYERLLLMRELLSDKGFIYLHCDWHKNSYLRLIMDEIFGLENFRNEIIWHYPGRSMHLETKYNAKHDTILLYAKNSKAKLADISIPWTKESFIKAKKQAIYTDEAGKEFIWQDASGGASKAYKRYLDDVLEKGNALDDVWRMSIETSSASVRTEYPTQKPEKLIERIIKASSNEDDLVADFFVGSGTTCAVAQKLGRRWIGCDINLGAIQTTTKRLNQIIEDQRKDKKIEKGFKGTLAFKVLNVNDYDVFKNELEAKEIVMEMYGVEPIKRTYFDGRLDKNFVKVMPLNRVLNKMDVRTLLKNINDKIDGFTVKTNSKSGEPVYEESVLIICSGMELDVWDFIKKENKTGVKIDVRDILTDKKNLIFKQKPEAKIKVAAKGGKLSVELKEFFSPILMRKLQIENEKTLKKDQQAKVEDFKQIVDSVVIDVDYNGKLFNAEIMDIPDKKEVIKSQYSWDYKKKGSYTVAVKVVDVLGEEYFETFDVTA